MARKPMFGSDGKPMFGATGKPLLCEPEVPCCGGGGCAASFTVESLGGNEYRFTDTSPGSHTRVWTSEDGGASTASPWTHTFPTDRMYWVELTITLPDETTCSVRHYIGDLNFCDSCTPNLVGETVYVTIPPVDVGTVDECENIRDAVAGTWAIDNLFSGAGCSWGTTSYTLGTCVRCLDPRGDVGNHGLSGTVAITEIGFPTVTDVEISATLQVASTANTDCDDPNGGGSATYTKTIPVGGGVDCRGSHTLNKTSETVSAHYIDWPDSVTVLIPG